MSQSNDLNLTKAQVEMFAAGLYQLASCDGIDQSETAIIHEFVTEAGFPELSESLAALTFDPATAYAVFGSSWLRRLFLKAAVMVIQADGDVTDAERETLAWMSVAFGITGGYEALVTEVAGSQL